ncbi:MAG: GNAT family N-acetyltransferase [Bacteroidales bacterium]
MTRFAEATPKDIPLLHTLGVKIFRQTYRQMLSEAQIEYMIEWMYSPTSLKKQMESNNTFYIVYYNETPCGYIGIEQQEETLFHLQRLYLDETMRGKNIGRLMMEKVFDHVRSTSNREATIELNVNRDNKTVEFYKKTGWHIIRSGDFHIGQGYYMTDHIMAIKIT